MRGIDFIGLREFVALVQLGCAATGLAQINQASELTAPERAGISMTNSEQVHRLTREEAGRAISATIRGVVTCVLPDSEAIVIQDSTRGIYVDQLSIARSVPTYVGELLEIHGVTDPGGFAPQLHARKVFPLGTGSLPQPIHPTWDQLINGSLDTQFVEMQGVVTAVHAEGLTLLTHGGKLQMILPGAGASTNALRLARYENSLVRLSGCLFASWDPSTHQVRVGEVCVYSPAIVVEEPAPPDVFAMPLKHIPELLLFDSQASSLRRTKVSGQVVHEQAGEFYLMDGTYGLRFIPAETTALSVGDLVEVVGFPSLTGPSPVLREAVARKTGNAPLPKSRALDPEQLFRAEYDSTRVRVEGVVLSLSADQRTLEMQTGLRRFLARVSGGAEPDPRRGQRAGSVGVPVGSRVALIGVYSGQGGNRTAGGEIGSFELLLNTAADLQILARPPFWTLRRLLGLVGALLGVLVVAVLWIRLLHHRVQERTSQLQKEIAERERAEHQRALAQERARIARDLHDDLGSSLTEITMLATNGPGAVMPSAEASERLETIAGKSRTMVHALDEIVWAADPLRDTLASVARYLASYAEEYLAGLRVGCRVQIPNSFPEEEISGEVRHHLFLAVKEALSNAVRHGNATEISFRVQLLEDRVQISIMDNGTGFELSGRSNGHGLLNLRDRLEKLSGQCEIRSTPAAGTTVSLQLPRASRNGRS